MWLLLPQQQQRPKARNRRATKAHRTGIPRARHAKCGAKTMQQRGTRQHAKRSRQRCATNGASGR